MSENIHNMFNFVYYIFGLIAISSSICMVFVTNPVHSALYLVLIYICAAANMLLLGVEFLAILLIVVYVGAIAILFLFVVMMLNVEFVEVEESLLDYVFMGFAAFWIFLMQVVTIIYAKVWCVLLPNTLKKEYKQIGYSSNIESIGWVLYNEYNLEIILSSFILLIAMIGAIILSLTHWGDLKRQETYKQLGRNFYFSILNKNIKL